MVIYLGDFSVKIRFFVLDSEKSLSEINYWFHKPFAYFLMDFSEVYLSYNYANSAICDNFDDVTV